MLAAANLINRIEIMYIVGDVVVIGNVESQAFADCCIGIGAVLSIRHGLITVKERWTFPGETQFPISRVVGVSLAIEVNEINVPDVFFAPIVGMVVVFDASVVIETEIEMVGEELDVVDGNQHLLKILAVVFFHEGVQFLSRRAPNMIPNRVGHRGEN